MNDRPVIRKEYRVPIEGLKSMVRNDRSEFNRSGDWPDRAFRHHQNAIRYAELAVTLRRRIRPSVRATIKIRRRGSRIQFTVSLPPSDAASAGMPATEGPGGR